MGVRPQRISNQDPILLLWHIPFDGACQEPLRAVVGDQDQRRCGSKFQEEAIHSQ